MKVVKFTGPAGSGKSTALQAIQFVLGFKAQSLHNVAQMRDEALAGVVAHASVEAVFLVDDATEADVLRLEKLGYNSQFAYVAVEASHG